MKHAYLIIAHNQWELLQMLVSAIDDPRNDIYLHIDKKVAVLPSITTVKAGLFYVKNRIDVRWGDVSQIECEYALFEEAYNSGRGYSYYHLLSGVDLPLKSQDYIHAFFEKNAGKEFIGYTELTLSPMSVRKVQRYHLFPKQFRSKSLVIRGIRAIFLKVQEILGIYRNRSIDFKKGSNWVSITSGLVNEVLSKKEWALKTFHHTFCADEMLVQTICWNSEFRKSIYNLDDDGKGCLRAIAWRDGCIYNWTAADYSTLADSDALFARKFNMNDSAFINSILALSANNH